MWMATVRGVDSVSNSPCVANSNFTSSTGSLVVCALSRCSLDARVWTGTTSLNSVKDRTVALLGTWGCFFLQVGHKHFWSNFWACSVSAISEHVQQGLHRRSIKLSVPFAHIVVPEHQWMWSVAVISHSPWMLCRSALLVCAARFASSQGPGMGWITCWVVVPVHIT